MPMDQNEIERLIKDALPDAEVLVEDLAGDGDHYAARVVSSAFKGKTRVQQHQMVYQALQGRMGGVLHALALQTSAPAHVHASGYYPPPKLGAFGGAVVGAAGKVA